MHEPPILPSEPNDSDSSTTEQIDNPFAPSAQFTETIQQGSPRVDLPPVFWIVLVLAALFFAFVTYTSQGFTLPGLVAILAASVRVPLVQRRQTRTRAGVQLPHSLLMLLASWAICFMGILASGIAFVAICIPTSILLMSGSGSDQGMMVAIGLSGFLAIAAFLLLFIVSLRLPC